jgi:hypothetical protein
VPWDGARLAIPPGYNYDILNDETMSRRDKYPVFVDGTADTVVWPKMPLPDVEGRSTILSIAARLTARTFIS